MAKSESQKVISLKQCHEVFQELIRSGEIVKTGTKFTKSRTEEIKAILERFSVFVQVCPSDENRKEKWIAEKKRITVSYHKMLTAISAKKKISGPFYHSEQFSEYATPNDPTRNDRDFEIEVCWTYFIRQFTNIMIKYCFECICIAFNL